MEEDKKKRKNKKKKKKKKQATKPTESVTRDARESTLESQSYVLEREQNSNGQVPGVIDSSNDVGGHIDVDRSGNHANVGKGTNLAEAEKQYQLDREVRTKSVFKRKLKNLKLKRMPIYRKRVSLSRESSSCRRKRLKMHKGRLMKEKVEKLPDEKNAFIQNERNNLHNNVKTEE